MSATITLLFALVAVIMGCIYKGYTTGSLPEFATKWMDEYHNDFFWAMLMVLIATGLALLYNFVVMNMK